MLIDYHMTEKLLKVTLNPKPVTTTHETDKRSFYHFQKFLPKFPENDMNEKKESIRYGIDYFLSYRKALANSTASGQIAPLEALKLVFAVSD